MQPLTLPWGRIFSRVRPFCERAVSDLDLSKSLTIRSQKGHTRLKIQPLSIFTKKSGIEDQLIKKIQGSCILFKVYFPPGALQKKIKVALQIQNVPETVLSFVWPDEDVRVSPLVSILINFFLRLLSGCGKGDQIGQFFANWATFKVSKVVCCRYFWPFWTWELFGLFLKNLAIFF
jgi:hypothetical protein